MDLGFVSIDSSVVLAFFSRDSWVVIKDLFAIFGWVVLAWLLLAMLVYLWKMEYKGKRFAQKWKWVLLAVDIPPLNEQTPKAVEQMFAHLAGAFEPPNIAIKFRRGYRQRWFSFEIISLEGYIQFLIRTEERLRDLLEAAIYAQYPEAEITEVEDYVEAAPNRFPDEQYDIWAGDFTLTENYAYPIRTYQEFEHKQVTKEEVIKDPMSAFLESFSRLGQGEQMWFQIIIEPTSNAWKEKAIKKIKEMIGENAQSGGLLASLTSGLVSKELGKSFEEINAQILGTPRAENEAVEASEGKLSSLTPGQAKLLEAMENKIRKIGFNTKMRGVYLARKEVFKPERGVNALVGAINQFNVPSANSLTPTFTTNISYFFKNQRINYRKKLLMQAYKKRKLLAGKSPFVLNIEELATVWHFPLSHVKTPLVQKAAGKKAEPPSGLPIEPVVHPSEEEIPAKSEEEKKTYRTDSGHVISSGGQPFG